MSVSVINLWVEMHNKLDNYDDTVSDIEIIINKNSSSSRMLHKTAMLHL
jgi:hypothetical protein